MRRVNLRDIPLASNVCNQMLREISKDSDWSIAHVSMNPSAWSLLHEHLKIHEIYVVTHGQGILVVGDSLLPVQAGNAVFVPPRQKHKLVNAGATSLEHLVLATPPFDPADVYLADERYEFFGKPSVRGLPPVQECFDGAQIIPYAFPEINASVAFGWVINDPERHKAPHYHKCTKEWAFVVEGGGFMDIDSCGISVGRGDLVEIEPGERHAFRNNRDQYMVVVCVCTPSFGMEDVYY